MNHSARPLLRLALVPALLALAGTAQATDGYFPIGVGLTAQGMGGAATAVANNAFAAANNPALAVTGVDQTVVGVSLFMPDRGMSRSGSMGGAGYQDANISSGAKQFYIPELSWNHAVSRQLGVGLSVYGNGGMNTHYDGGQIPANMCGAGAPAANVLCGVGTLGVNLSQLIVAPTIAYKVDEHHSFGVSPLLIYQQFSADGLQAFTQMSADPSHVTNNGLDSSHGLGVRLGYFGTIGAGVHLGASYSPKTSMSAFSQYAGLFAGGGKFDIPENYALGLSAKASPALLLAVDYQRINYSKVPAIGNSSSNMAPLGSTNGPGFGWSNVNVYKIGAEWQANSALKLRAGFNLSDNPVQGSNVTFNILAPGVVTRHYTLGGSYAVSPQMDVTVAYMVAPTNSVSGTSSLPFGGNETVHMKEQSLGVQVGWHF